MPHQRWEISPFELQNQPLVRSVDLGFDCFEGLSSVCAWILEFALGFMKRSLGVLLGFGISFGGIQSGS